MNRVTSFVVFLFVFLNSPFLAKGQSTTAFAQKWWDSADKDFFSVIDTSAFLEVLGQGYSLSEGPVWVSDLKGLLFSDVPQNKVYLWTPEKGVTDYLLPSGYSGYSPNHSREGANGLALDGSGKLILCQHGDRRLARMKTSVTDPKPAFETLAEKWNGRRFNSPNDLWIDEQGGIFFTDPPYGLVGQDADEYKELPWSGIFYRHQDGRITLIDSTISRPNGIYFDSMTKKLWVANSDPKAAQWWIYTLSNDLSVQKKELFYDATDRVNDTSGLPDGMKPHRSGLIFATGPGGVLVFHKEKGYQGTILTGTPTANCALDEAHRFLYITANDRLLRLKLKD